MIKVNIEKAKEIAHDIRRTAREKEFEPLDNIISKRIPGKALEDAELERQAIREKYTGIQTQIDTVDDILALTEIVSTLKGSSGA